MNVICNLGLGLLMIVIGIIVFDWGRIWYHARRHGYIKKDGDYGDPPWRWEQSYLGYKVWTWVVRVFTWFVAVWHVVLSFSWFTDFLFEVTT